MKKIFIIVVIIFASCQMDVRDFDRNCIECGAKVIITDEYTLHGGTKYYKAYCEKNASHKQYVYCKPLLHS